jgi:hypothetical protein
MDKEEDSHSYDQAMASPKLEQLIEFVEQEIFRPARKHGYPDPQLQALLESPQAAELISLLESKYYEAKKELEL